MVEGRTAIFSHDRKANRVPSTLMKTFALHSLCLGGEISESVLEYGERENSIFA
jgi:hypothetical protein